MIDTQQTLIDISLLERVARRDVNAMSELYDRVAPPLYGIIARILQDERDAEDVLQEVFLRIWQRAQSFDPALGSPMVWLVRIARNLSIDRLRSKTARARNYEDTFAEGNEPSASWQGQDPYSSAELSQLREAVSTAVARLPAEQRVLIEYAYFRGFTQSELAEHFGIPLGTVKTRIRSAMSSLRDQLRRLM